MAQGRLADVRIALPSLSALMPQLPRGLLQLPRLDRDSAVMACVVVHMVVLGAVIGLRLLPGQVSDAGNLETAMALLSGSLMCLLVLFDWPRHCGSLAASFLPTGTAKDDAAPAASACEISPLRSSEPWNDCAKLMSRISHELRTPLNAIIGFADMMQRELLGPIGHPRYREYVDHIRDSGAGLLKSAEDIMTLTTVAAGTSHAQPAPIALGPIVRDACRAVAAIIDAKRVRMHVSGVDQRTMWGDRQALQVVVANLIAVAVDRAPYAATIVVRIAGTLAQPRLEIAVSAPAMDAALPAPSEDIPDLAVAVAQCLVRLQGGRLMTTTAADGGWSVRIILPGGGVATPVAWSQAA